LKEEGKFEFILVLNRAACHEGVELQTADTTEWSDVRPIGPPSPLGGPQSQSGRCAIKEISKTSQPPCSHLLYRHSYKD
jgi:hypothetical protein